MPPEDVGADPISRLSHSLQQLDRIDSLSEQISFLEERLETCKCLENQWGMISLQPRWPRGADVGQRDQ